jgi:hypothetical protein
MRPRALLVPLLTAGLLALAGLFSAAEVAQAQCGSGSGACVEYSPSAAAPGTVVTLTPATDGDQLPVIQSTDCAPGARVNVDFVKNGVVVALSPLSGTRERAQFRVPQTAAGNYRVDLYCPDGNTAVTIEPNFQVLPPDTATLAPDSGSGPGPITPLTATYALALLLGVLAFSKTKLIALDRTPRFGVRTILLQDRRLSRRGRSTRSIRPMARRPRGRG